MLAKRGRVRGREEGLSGVSGTSKNVQFQVGFRRAKANHFREQENKTNSGEHANKNAAKRRANIIKIKKDVNLKTLFI